MTSPASSTTQIEARVAARRPRRSRQRGASARLKQISHRPMRSLTSRIDVGERGRVLGRGAQDVEREPLRGARADPGQLAELGDQALDGGAYKRGSRPAATWPAAGPRPPRSRPPVRPPILLAASSWAWRMRLVDGGEDHVLQQLGVLGIDRLGIDRDVLDDEVAGDRHGDHAAAGATTRRSRLRAPPARPSCPSASSGPASSSGSCSAGASARLALARVAPGRARVGLG